MIPCPRFFHLLVIAAGLEQAGEHLGQGFKAAVRSQSHDDAVEQDQNSGFDGQRTDEVVRRVQHQQCHDVRPDLGGDLGDETQVLGVSSQNELSERQSDR